MGESFVSGKCFGTEDGNNMMMGGDLDVVIATDYSVLACLKSLPIIMELIKCDPLKTGNSASWAAKVYDGDCVVLPVSTSVATDRSFVNMPRSCCADLVCCSVDNRD